MGFTATAGRIVCTDASGNTKFDSNEKLFVITDFVSGMVTGSSFTASAATNDISVADATNNYSLGSVNASADTIRGAFKMSTTDARGIAISGWFNASGTYVHMWEGGGGVLTNLTDNIRLSRASAYTFLISGGVAYLRERCFMTANYGGLAGTTQTVTVAAPTFQYKLFAGTFV